MTRATWRRWGAAVLTGARWAGRALLTGLQAVDLRDVFFFGGLALAGYGGVMLSRPWTLIIVGAVVTLKGNGPIWPARR